MKNICINEFLIGLTGNTIRSKTEGPLEQLVKKSQTDLQSEPCASCRIPSIGNTGLTPETAVIDNLSILALTINTNANILIASLLLLMTEQCVYGPT